MAAEEQVKKRRQNVACDACKLRRVRCDLSTLLELPALDSVPGLGTPAPSLADLVRQNPYVECTNCSNKGIKCSTHQILNPTRPKKGGRRIDEARKMFGGGDDEVAGSDRERSAKPGASGGRPGPSVEPVAPSPAYPNASPVNWAQDLLSSYGLQPGYPSPNQLGPSLAPPEGPFATYHVSNVPHGSASAAIHPHIDSLGDPTDDYDGQAPIPHSGDNFGGHPSHATTPYCNNSPSSSNVPGRKKRRAAAPTGGTRDKVVVRRKDPWHLWADPGSQAAVSWGLAEDVQESLADKALGVELSRHLVTTFFQAVHHFYPSIWPESFHLEWARAGQRSDRMTPAQEVLCATIEAWGAHYSDSPVILGPPPDEPSHTDVDGTLVPEHHYQAYWGQARNNACIALINRARRIADANGIFRKPSLTGVQSLALFCQLLHASNMPGKADEIQMEVHMIQVTILEQMKVLGLMWQSDKSIVTDKAELPVSQTELRIKQIRLFWSQMVIDTYWSASYAQPSGISDEEFEAAGNCMASLKGALPPVSFQGLSLFVSVYYRIAKAGRDVTTKLAIPNRKKGAVDVDKFCSDVRHIWEDVKFTSKDLDRRTAAILKDCRQEDFVGFSPLNYLTHNQLAGPFFPFLIHKIIWDQVRFRKDILSSYTSAKQNLNLSSPASERKWAEAQEHVDKLEALQQDSVDMLLCCCRRLVSVSEILLPTGVMQVAAAVVLGVLLAGSQLLASVPTNEQGYPVDTPGGYGWTWKKKQEAIECCIKVLNEVGWAWSDAGKLLKKTVLPAMEQSARLHRELSANPQATFCPPPLDSEVAQRQLEQDREIRAALDAVMRYWPPTSEMDISATSNMWADGNSHQPPAFPSGAGASYHSINPNLAHSDAPHPPPSYNPYSQSQSSFRASPLSMRSVPGSAYRGHPGAIDNSQSTHHSAPPAMVNHDGISGMPVNVGPSAGHVMTDSAQLCSLAEVDVGQEFQKFFKDWGMGPYGSQF
ncbi:hypothetical protein IAR50_006785 [Cryptococcus sp. DSM 104548]